MRLPILASGMVTPVGYDALASCAAMRAALDGFRKTRFELDGDWIRAAVVQTDELSGLAKLMWMASTAVDQCMVDDDLSQSEDTAIALCLPELDRPGRIPGLDHGFFARLCDQLPDRGRLGRLRQLFSNGSVGGVEALKWADTVLQQGAANYALVVGVDSYVHGPTLVGLHAARRLLTSKNSDGVLPGEAAAAVLLSRQARGGVQMECTGVGWGREPATRGSGRPLRGDGLASAYRAALREANCTLHDVHYRIADAAGDHYAFKEAALGLLRTLRDQREEFYLWQPSSSVGCVGAASVPLALGVALAAARRSYAPGPGVLCHFAADSGARAALVLQERNARAVNP